MYTQITLQPLTTFWWWPIVLVIAFYLVAWLIHRSGRRLAPYIMTLNRLAPLVQRIRHERWQTLQGLIAGTITFIAFTAATFASLSLFVHIDTLVWVVGLFSAAFGLGMRPIVSDLLTGLSFIFEQTFEVGEKIEVAGLPGGSAEGVVEAVNLRTSFVRAPTGELLIIPNGEIRVVRNFSRGLFSPANVKLKIDTEDIREALMVLEGLAAEALIRLPNLLEPWQVLSESGEMGRHTQLTVVAKARFGKAAEMRPRLLALIQEHIEGTTITLSD